MSTYMCIFGGCILGFWFLGFGSRDLGLGLSV